MASPHSEEEDGTNPYSYYNNITSRSNANSSVRPSPAPRLWSHLSNFSRKSFRSFTSSFEADDELSSSENDCLHDYHLLRYSRGWYGYGSMADYEDLEGDRDRNGARSLLPFGREKYPGEDTRPTSRKELAGWYAYSFAAETYVICGKLVLSTS